MPIVPMTRSKMAHIIENGKSLFKDAPSTTTGVIKAHTPITTIRLNMFEPVTLLTASVLLCAMDAATLTAVSGSEVPIATIVNPMISDGTLKRFATLELPSTNRSAPFTKNTKPTMRQSSTTINGALLMKFSMLNPPFFYFLKAYNSQMLKQYLHTYEYENDSSGYL